MFNHGKTSLPWLFLGPPLALMAVLGLVPTIAAINLALKNRVLRYADSDYVGLRNFVRLASDRRFLNAIEVSALWEAVTVAGAVAVGIVLAVFLFERVHGRWRHAAALILIMPVLLPRVSAAFIWKFMYAPLTGILGWLLGALGMTNVAWLADPRLALAAVARWLYVEMLKSGYTSVCEFHYVHHAPDGTRYARPAELAARVVGAARDAGIGITMLPVAYQYSGFGERAPRDDQRRFINTPDALLALVDALRGELPEHGGLRYGIAPHSLRAVSESGLRALVGAMPADAPVHIHIAEQTAEVDDCVRAYGARPVRWLLERFDVNARWCLVHATHLDAAETQALARSGATAGLCPTTEANLGDGIFPAVDYLAAGGAIGIGSDSHASVDWRAELRLFEYGQRLVRRERARPSRLACGKASRQVAERMIRAFSRSQSRFFSVSRLSCSFLPFARPISHFTRPPL